jgi:hypothetical protein
MAVGTYEAQVEQRCIRCKAVKAPGKFAINRRRRDGRNAVCKQCLAVASAERESAFRQMPPDERVTIRGFTSLSHGDITYETIVARRDEHILLLGAAFARWQACEDQEERQASTAALVYRSRQLIEAERRCKACGEEGGAA